MITSYLSNSIFAYLVLSNIRSRRWWIFFKGHQTDSSLLSPILAEHIGQRAEADPSLNRLHPVKSSGAKTGNPPLGVSGWVGKTQPLVADCTHTHCGKHSHTSHPRETSLFSGLHSLVYQKPLCFMPESNTTLTRCLPDWNRCLNENVVIHISSSNYNAPIALMSAKSPGERQMWL